MMLAAICGIFLARAAWAADPLTLQLRWMPQAQFAGYFVARDKGFYQQENLDVTITPGGPDIAPTQALASGAADVAVEWMPAALAARAKGLGLVNIAQPFVGSGLMLTCLKESGITDPKTDLRGKTVGTWFMGAEHSVLAWMNQQGIAADGGADGVTLLSQGSGVDLLLNKQAACISTMSYNEYGQLLDAGIAADDLVTFRLDDHGAATLEDGLYTLETAIKDPGMLDRLARFVRASMQGWRYAEANPREAVAIVLKNAPGDATTQAHQLRMMQEIVKLTAGSTWVLDPAAAERTVQTLLSKGPGPVIAEPPVQAWTHLVTDKAFP